MSFYFALAVPSSIVVIATLCVVQCAKPKKKSNEQAGSTKGAVTPNAGSNPSTPAASDNDKPKDGNKTPATTPRPANTPDKKPDAGMDASKPPNDPKKSGKDSQKSDDTDLRSVQMDQLKEADKQKAYLLHQNAAAQNRSARVGVQAADEPGVIQSGYAAPQPLNAVVPAPTKPDEFPKPQPIGASAETAMKPPAPAGNAPPKPPAAAAEPKTAYKEPNTPEGKPK